MSKCSCIFIKLLDKILPKDKNKVILTSFPDFSDGTKIFYDYLKSINQDKFKKIIWIYASKNPTGSDLIQGKKLYLRSLKGIWNLLRAKYIVHEHCDIFLDYLASSKHVLFNLWHGMPIKAIGKLDDGLLKSPAKRYKYVSKNSYMFVISDIYRLIMSSLMNIDPKKIFVTGQARTDTIFHSKEQEIKDLFDLNGFKHIVLYMPTYKTRPTGNDVDTSFDNIFYLDKYSDNDFLSFLESNEILFIIKPHPFEEKEFKNKIKKTPLIKHANIRILYDNNFIENNLFLNELFSLSDLMISDFSSVTIDYAMLNKPILYLSNYLEEYKNGRGLILPDNFKIQMPGENVVDYETLKTKTLECLKNKKANYSKGEVSLLHKYQDGKSCERIFEIMKNL